MLGTNSNSSSLWGLLVLVFLFFVVFGGNGLFGNNKTDTCERVSNCEVERREIIDSAQTQFGVLNQGQLTREAVRDDGDKTRTKIDFYAYEELKDKLACERAEKIELRGMLYSNEKFNSIERRLDCLPAAPPYYARGFVTSGQCIPSNCSTSTQGVA